MAKKNPQDATLRNVNASRRAEHKLAGLLDAALARIADLERRMEQVELRQRDVPDDDPVQ